MIDSNEKVQAQVDTQTSGVSIQSEDTATELKKKELNKRALVEQEIKEHPIFKSMQKSLEGTQVKLDIDDIVDKYFDLTSDKNILDNKEFYKVNPDVILQSLQETMYIISSEENGIVLDDSGEIDKEASLQQQAQAVYSGALKRELLQEDETKKQQFEDSFEMFYKDKDNVLQYSAEHKIVKEMLMTYATKELSTEEIIQITEKYLNNAAVQETQEALKNSILLDTSEEVFQLDYSVQFVELMTEGATADELSKVYKQIMKYNSNGRFEVGEIQGENVDKIIGFATDYGHRYSQRKNYKELANFANDGTDFQLKSAEDQREILKSIYFLSEMTNGGEKEFAILNLKRISPSSLDLVDGKLQINKERFLNLYNSTLPITHNKKSIEEVENDVVDRNKERLREHIDSLKRKIEKGEFTEFRMPKGLSKEEAKEFHKQMQKEIHKAQIPKIDKTPEQRLERAIDQFIKENKFEGNRAELVIAAYKQISKIHTDDAIERTAEDFKKHIQGLGSRYGSYFIQTREGKNNGISSAQLGIEEKNFDLVEKLADSIVKFHIEQEEIEQNKNSIKHIKEHLLDMKYAVGQSSRAVFQVGKGIFKNIFGKHQKQLPPGQEEKINSIFGKNKDIAEIGKAIEEFKKTLQLNRNIKRLKFRGTGLYYQIHRVKNISQEKNIAKVERRKLFGNSKEDISVEEIKKSDKKMTFDELYRAEQSIEGTNRVSKEFKENQNKVGTGEKISIKVETGVNR